ncbi:molybdenum cofactor guanylyltransferase [Microbacterium koreense]|uniref:Molybdenum cofactor guanylyltransferase n=1 Tax=Microbacterium koreense TaxID=323761 RepID=A0ABW2ZQH1_9MICO
MTGGAPPPVHTIGAVLLAGGRASRMDGVAKPLLDVGGRSLLVRAVDAAASCGADPITVVGPELDAHLPVTWVREDPPFGGPAAAIVAAVNALADDAEAPEWMLVLACDLPTVDAAVRVLVNGIALQPTGVDGLCLTDDTSRPQWLIGIYRTAALRRGVAGIPAQGRDAPVRALLDDLAIATITTADSLTRDVDTWDDLSRARDRVIEETP